MKKRLLSVVLALGMVIGMMPVNVIVEYNGVINIIKNTLNQN